MIRINLLASERAQAKKKTTFQTGQKLTVGCSLILVLAGIFVGWRYWSLTRQSAQIDAEVAAAQQEVTRLHSVIQKVQDFEQRKTQLSQRVSLIEELRKEQKGPVHLLDEISKGLPPMVWLTEVKQVTGKQATGSDVQIEGNSTTQTGVSDFVTNLEASGYFQKSIEIVATKTVVLPQPPGELVSFTLRTQFLTPGEPKPAAVATSAPKR
jgi:type IV pilus assembly protein PilN